MVRTRNGSRQPLVGRRHLLKYGGAAGLAANAVVGAETVRSSPSVAAEVVAPETWELNPFALADVELRESVFTRKRDLMLDYARGYDANRLLSVFRANAGLHPGAAVAPGGWEGLDGEANGNLRGHYGGHFLSMLAQAYASNGEPVFDAKLTEMVAGLHECRESLRRENPWVLSVPGRFGQAIENVTTTRLRATFQAYPDAGATSYSALGVSEWEVWGGIAEADADTVIDLPAVHTRTTPGVVPHLPGSLDVVRLNGKVTPVDVTWQAVDPATLVAGTAHRCPARRVRRTPSAPATSAKGLSVRVTATKPQHAAGAAEAAATTPVSKAATTPVLEARPKRLAAGAKARLTVRVRAVGVTPTGTVRIYDGRRLVRTIRLDAGVGQTRIKIVGRGRHRLVAKYSGTAWAVPSSGATVVTAT